MNLGSIEKAVAAGKLDAKQTINAEAPEKSSLIRKQAGIVKLLGKGEVKASSPSR